MDLVGVFVALRAFSSCGAAGGFAVTMPTAKLELLVNEIRACTACAAHLPLGPRPVVQIGRSATLCIIGQAPGTRVHETGVPWNDASGERLRQWTGIDRATFYDAHRLAIMPMGFCYPGVNAAGGDKPPRLECAPLWHARLLRHMPNIRLTLLVGQYAQRAYLLTPRAQSMTATVEAYRTFLPAYFPLPHPSWRTVGWQRRHAWFDDDVLPQLRRRVYEALA
jgi:uracil-DNA glycosylase